jgi:hypothetical protein
VRKTLLTASSLNPNRRRHKKTRWLMTVLSIFLFIQLCTDFQSFTVGIFSNLNRVSHDTL